MNQLCNNLTKQDFAEITEIVIDRFCLFRKKINRKNSLIGVVMDLIRNNPYRVIGVFADASEREMQKQKSIIKAYLSAGKELKFDYDFSFLPEPIRNSDTIATAYTRLQFNPSKLLHSLFWFTKGSHIDEPALNYLRDGNISKAIEIWSKVTASNESIHQYYSAFNNLGTLKIALGLSKQNIHNIYWEKFEQMQLPLAQSEDNYCYSILSDGVKLKLMLLQSPEFEHYAAHITDETYKPVQKESTINFVGELINYLFSETTLTASISYFDAFKLFSTASKEAVTYAQQRITEYPIKKIEQKIKETQQSRESKPSIAVKISSALNSYAKKELSELKKIWGVSNYKYEAISDKVALEILQCSIDYFEYYEDDNEIDPSQLALKISNTAMKLAIGSQAKQRVEENLTMLYEWIEEAPKRNQVRLISSELEEITNLVNTFQARKGSSIIQSHAFAIKCLPYLKQISTKMTDRDLFLNVSSTVVSEVLNKVIETINSVIEKSVISGTILPYFREEVALSVKNAFECLRFLNGFQVHPNLKERLRINFDDINDMNNKLNPSQPTRQPISQPAPQPTLQTQSSSGTGCLMPLLSSIFVCISIISILIIV